MPELVTLGIIVADMWCRPVDEWPSWGTLGLVEEVGIGLGGCAANTALGYRRLGGESAVIGCLGNDALGDFAQRTLEEGGVECSLQRTDKASTSGTLIPIAGDGERTFLHCTGANGLIDPTKVDMDLICSAEVLALLGVLLMPGFDGPRQVPLLAEAQKAGVTTVVDTAWDDTGKWMETVGPLLPYVDLFLPSYGEAAHLAGREDPSEIAEVLMNEGVGVVGIKMGPEGSYLRTADAEYTFPAYTIEAVDGTGAGDAWVAGFLYGWIQGWELERTGRFANAVGAQCCLGLGTTAGIQSAERTLAWMEQQASRS
jgi:sugar/nucleoside kinase (ribokinase family)